MSDLPCKDCGTDIPADDYPFCDDCTNTCDSCGDPIEDSEWQTYCDDCTEWTAVIAVRGEVNDRSMTGVYGQAVYAADADTARARALETFRENPPYTESISVNSDRWPDGTYLESFGYDTETATVVSVHPADELSTLDVNWRRFGDEALSAFSYRW